jgi:mRNA interferase RelE/StbE
MYNVIIDKQILKVLDNIPEIYLLKIRSAINALSENPRPQGCKKLSNSENNYRIRIGVYRIIYSIEDNILLVKVIRIAHRQSAYK